MSTNRRSSQKSASSPPKKLPSPSSASSRGSSGVDPVRKVELIQRTLGIRHKLKVHDSMKAPDTHEDLAMMLGARWELEDELEAIEEILGQARRENVEEKKKLIREGILGKNKKKKF